MDITLMYQIILYKSALVNDEIALGGESISLNF
jgi:hypothetical protein